MSTVVDSLHVILTTHSLSRSGGFRQMLYHAQELHERRIAVTLVLQKGAPISTDIPNTIRVFEWSNTHEAVQQLRALLVPHTPTVIHTYHSCMMKLISWYGMLWKMEFPLLRCFAHRGVSHYPKNPLPYWLTGIDCFLPNAQATAEKLRLYLPFSKNIITVYNGVPEHRIHPSPYVHELQQSLSLDPNKVTFASVLNTSPTKGGKELLEAFSLLPQNTQLVLIGIPETFVRQYVTDPLVLARIRTIQTEYVADILYKADCFVFPSLSFDSQPNVILEAMGCSLPIIATNVGGVAEIFSDNGILLQDTKQHALYAAMLYVTQNNHMLPLWRSRSKVLFKNFSITKRVDRLLDIYYHYLFRADTPQYVRSSARDTQLSPHTAHTLAVLHEEQSPHYAGQHFQKDRHNNG